MNSIRLLIVKLIQKILTLFKRGGSFPGSIALKMDKDILNKFKMPKIVVIVTGTNGKTTTSNLIAESLKQSGLKVVNNRRGDNLNVGIATLLCANSNLNYEVQADAVVLEIDELTVYRVFSKLHPTSFVVNNFFRDQLDRAGEMETIVRKIESVIKEYTGNLILNANDPNVVRLKDSATKAQVYFYGVDACSVSSTTTDEASEGKFCPRCGNPLQYDYYQYSHIGKFHCTKDDFGNCPLTIEVTSVDFDKEQFIVDGKVYHNFMNSIYAIYNCAATLCLMKVNNLDGKYANEVFSTFTMKEGRNEVFALKKPCVINLVKNPTGANEVMKYIMAKEDEKNICIILNDNDQDGHDVSWIWDAHFERLKSDKVHKIVCSGLRAYDIALRLKYEGLENYIVVYESVDEAIGYLDNADMDSYVIATYTALHSTRAILRRHEA